MTIATSPAMRNSLLALLLFVSLAAFAQPRAANPLAEYGDKWKDARFQACNTAKNVSYMSQVEKDVVYILNMARTAPRLFAETVIGRANDVSEFLGREQAGSYYASLIAQLNNMKPLGILRPDSLCTVSARCHAVSSGKKGYVGHVRQSAECRKKSHYMGECCHYGSDHALEVVVLLLQDQGVADLGHRKICLGDYARIGVAVAPHRSDYGHIAVLDFY